MQKKITLFAILAGQIAQAAPVVTVTNIVTQTTFVPPTSSDATLLPTSRSTNRVTVTNVVTHTTWVSPTGALSANNSTHQMSGPTPFYTNSSSVAPSSSHRPTGAPLSSFASYYTGSSSKTSAVAIDTSSLLPIITRPLPAASSSVKPDPYPLSNTDSSRSTASNTSSTTLSLTFGSTSVPATTESASASTTESVPSSSAETASSSSTESISTSSSTVSSSDPMTTSTSASETTSADADETTSTSVSETASASTSDATTSNTDTPTSTPAPTSSTSEVAFVPPVTFPTSTATAPTDAVVLPYATILPSDIHKRSAESPPPSSKQTNKTSATSTSSTATTPTSTQSAEDRYSHVYPLPGPDADTDTDAGNDGWGDYYPLPGGDLSGLATTMATVKSTAAGTSSAAGAKQTGKGGSSCVFPLPGQEC